jgi:SAM-dependent methyltransferase
MRQDFFICPRCRSKLERATPDCLSCPQDGLEFRNVDGIWRFLLPEIEAHYQRFITDYETVRRFEGRGSSDAEYYRALPFKDLSGNFSADWAIRARSFLVVGKKILAPLKKRLQRPLNILDLGAGNGWLSNRLASQGNNVVAVDLLVNEQDGLGAWKHYERSCVPIQAEFNRLPVMNDFIDVVIFNASFHYSENYEETLAASLRVLNENGLVVIVDSPIYHHHTSGEKMVEERKSAYLAQYGFASDSLESENFLTYHRMSELSASLDISLQYIRPFYGLRWWFRPVKAWLLGQREPAKFQIIVGSNKVF